MKRDLLAKGFYVLLYRRRYFLFVSELIKGLGSREITSLPEIKKVINMARHFSHGK